ncbi:MAG TPA: cell surface protein SprA, partial [Anseongella sp.]|nr:cell surface protein SprA [Anseongella sp.]
QLWVNELRLSGFDEEGGWAASARLNAQLADFANVTLSGSKSTFGFGSLERQVGQLNRYDNSQFDMASSFELGKFLPDSLGFKIPMYVSYSQDIRRPQYNPLSPDILLKDALDRLSGSKKDSLMKVTDDVVTRKSINFTNVRKLRLDPESKPHFYDIENFSLTYAFSEFRQEGFTLANSLNKTYKAALAYNFQGTPKNFRPFGQLFQGKLLGFLGDLNFTPLPSVVDFRIDVDRYYSENTIRAAEPGAYFNAPTTYFKNFQITRLYGLRWDLARSLQLDYTASNLSIVDEPDGPITGANRDSVMSNLRKLGRTTDFSQGLNLSYSVPVNKLPYLDWINLNTRYSVQYNWQAEPLSTLLSDTINLGNTIRNERQIQLNPQINLERLYEKFGLRSRRPPSRPGADSIRNSNGGGASQFFLGLLTSLKTISGSYSIGGGTFLPGYTPRTNILGMDLGKNAPGLGFVLGSQKDIRFKAARNGWLTRDENLNSLYYRTRREDLNLRAILEPFADFRIELTGIRLFSANVQSNFRFDQPNNTFREFSPVTTGSFSISTIALKTTFKKERGITNFSELFETFKSSRLSISRRLGASNPYSQGLDSAGYADGYGATSQKVLVNAFLSAYLGKDPASMSLDQFPNIPLPNWNVTYNGLNRLPLFSDLFSSVIINHGYQSTYSIANYNSLLQFRRDVNGIGYEKDIQQNFYPEYQVSFVNITEEFIPLLGADMRFRNNMTANFEYRKRRALSFSLANSQLAQQKE